MSKTDKELTVEVVNNYVSSWNASDRTNAIKSDVLQALIKDVHRTIQNLPESTKQED